MESGRLRLDLEQFGVNYETVRAELDTYQVELDDLAGFSVNVNSPKDLEKVFIDKYGMTPMKVNVKSGRMSFAKEVIEQYDTPATRLVITVKSLKSELKYFESVSTLRDGEYLNFEWAEESKSGGLYAKNPAVLSFPQRLREVIIPEEGNVFVMGAYRFQDLSIIAHVLGDQKLLEDIRAGRNIISVLSQHTETPGNVIYSILQEFVRGAAPDHIATKVFLDPIKVNFILGRVFNYYPVLKGWLDKPKQVLEQGCADTLFGERYNLDESNHDREKEARVGVNYIGQGSAAHILREAMKKLSAYTIKLTIHSAIIVEVSPIEVEKALQDLQESMLSILPEAMTVRTSTGPSWGALYPTETVNE